jgi:hypothetical protein
MSSRVHLGGLEIDCEIKLDRLLYRQVGRFGTLQDTIDIRCRVLELIRKIATIRKETANLHILSSLKKSVGDRAASASSLIQRTYRSVTL